jgi:hypothetical protein
MPLIDLFSFTEGDLQANKRGELSPRQKRQLRGRLLANIGLAVFLVGGALLMLVNIFGATDTWVAVAFVVLLNLLALGALVISIRNYRKRANITAPGVVVGSPKLHQRTVMINNRSQYRYSLTIDSQNVAINADAYQKLDRGGIYRLYFVPGTDTLLSIEHAQQAAPQPTANTTPPSPQPTAPKPTKDYLPHPDMDMQLLVEIYMKDKPLVITTTNDPSEDRYRQGEWFKAAEKLIRQRADEAVPYLKNYPLHPLTTELATDEGDDPIPALMDKARAEKNKWSEVQKQIEALPQDGMFDRLVPYTEASQPETLRMIAVRIIAKLDDPRRVAVLREAAQSKSRNLYTPAVYGLGEAGTGADVVAPFLQSDDASNRRMAEDALFQMGDPRGLEAIRERAYALAEDEKKQTQAVRELVKVITEPRARKYLEKMTKSKKIGLSIDAKQAVNKLKSHADPTVAEWAKNVMKK